MMKLPKPHPVLLVAWPLAAIHLARAVNHLTDDPWWVIADTASIVFWTLFPWLMKPRDKENHG